MALQIEDYALIGDCKTAALVGRDGSINWLCWPRFDSAACFAALLGNAENGRWLIAPKDWPLSARRRYRPGTLVLETEFQTKTGSAAVIDFMAPANGALDRQKSRQCAPPASECPRGIPAFILPSCVWPLPQLKRERVSGG